MKELFTSLAAFQQEVPVIHKGKEGYGYSFADLPAIFEVINPLLKKHGLGFTQLLTGTSIKTIIFHVNSGQTIESVTDIPQGVTLAKMNDFQVLGSAITYIRRYALSAALGLVTDKDTDAAGEQTKQTPQPKSDEIWLNVGDANWLKMLNAKDNGKEISVASIKKKYKCSKATLDELNALGIY